ncbi:MAG: hypothetical protein GXP54_05675 [Deltaproteobacteria bacterium]|nr:hypothetical protein [Deltaproteobacteria bacterium]
MTRIIGIVCLAFCFSCGWGTAGIRAPGGDDAQASDLSGIDEPGPRDVSPDAAGPCGVAIPGLFPVPVGPAWSAPNAYSWDGSWVPSDADFPLAGLLDGEYFDGHDWEGQPSPVLPPGVWDWDDNDDDLANWRNFDSNLGHFVPLLDHCDRQYGWRLIGNDPGQVDFSGPAEYFLGSSGTDVLYLGSGGSIHSISGNLGEGPDVLVFNAAWSLDFGTGPAVGGSSNDDDLVVAGCGDGGGLSEQFYDIWAASIHTGPGRDMVFARDLRAAAVDAGNGDGGNTSVLDPTDGDDLVVFRGSVKDVRFFGGMGNDTLVWYVDEMREATPYAGGDFFGGGGAGEAIWGDPGTDRLVLVVPEDTKVVGKPATPQGAVLVMTAFNEHDPDPWWDGPTVQDPNAKYCITCGVGPDGQRTIYLQYVSRDGKVDTGYVSVTDFEELQLGVGPDAVVYRLDDVNGKAEPDTALKAFVPPDEPDALCDPAPF